MGNGSSTGSRFDPHEHSLSLRNDLNLIGDEFKCKLCTNSITPPFYACDVCKHYVHKSCGDLPHQMDHSFHSHPLFLFSGVSTSCRSCYKHFEDSPFYKCEQCAFKMDVECAIMPSKTLVGEENRQRRSIQYFSHPHPLFLFKASDRLHQEEAECFACESKLLPGDLIYRCSHCKYSLHKSCVEFPKKSLSGHSLHPHHGTLSVVTSTESFTCSVCEASKYRKCNFSFKCRQCKFQMCWGCCTRVTRNVEMEDHEHALCFIDNTELLGRGRQCNGYDAYCRQPLIYNKCDEFKQSKSSIFKCLDCDFKLHFLCGSLPSSIKHECHIHALSLLDFLVEDDSGEYCCDVCETDRDPRIRLYYCKECKYCAHVHCLISEIVNVLRGDLKGVKLMALGKATWKSAEEEERGYESTTMTLMDLIDQIVNAKEKKELETHFEWDTKWSKKPEKPPMEKTMYLSKELNEILKLYSFTSTSFVNYCNELQDHYKGRKSTLTGSDLGLPLVKVNGYKIPRSLANVLEALFNEFECDNIISRGSVKSPEMKSFILFVLCRTIKKMRATLVKDITKYLLREWFFHLRFVKNQGFEIGFAIEQAESLVDVFLGLQAERLGEEVPKEIKAKMAKLEKKMENLREEMTGFGRDLEKCNEYRDLVATKSEYMKYCMRKASEFRWHNAFDIHVGECSSVPREKWKW